MDRVLDAYLGRDITGRLVADTRARVDWIVEQLEGPKVLDIGCSQGVVALLAAEHRQLHITGVDTEVQTIATAKSELKNRAPEVQERIQFLHANFYEIEPSALPYEEYDCLVLGQILEHLSDPGSMLERARPFIRQGGQLIVTVPFGVWEHDEHEITFYATTLWDLLTPNWRIEEMRVIGGRLAAIARNEKGPGLPKEDAISVDYANFPEKEQWLFAQLRSAQNRAAKSRDEAAALKEKLDQLTR